MTLEQMTSGTQTHWLRLLLLSQQRWMTLVVIEEFVSWHCLKRRGLHIVHLNVQSLLPKIDEVREIARRMTPGVLCFTETWLDDTIQDPEVEIINYTCVRKDRNRNGGGVATYIRNDIAFDTRKDMDSELEATWIHILLQKTKPILIGTCYRPPTQNDFYSTLDEVCSNATDFLNSEVIITGDLNTNVGAIGYNSLVNALKTFCSVYDLKQIIKEPTRVCKTSKSTIDLILVSDFQKICQSGVINYGLSDHMVTYCTRKVSKQQINGHNTLNVRSLKHYSKELFCERLSAVNWFPVINCNDIDKAWLNFKTLFIGVLDSIAPAKTIRVKQRSEPWFASEILNLIKLRDKALCDFNKTKTPSNFVLYKRLRNEVKAMVDKAKVDYYKDNLHKNKNNPKKLWQTIKQLGSSKNTKSKSSNIGLNIDGIVSFDKSAVATKFNTFFTTIASTLVNNLPTPIGNFGKQHIIDFYRNKGVTQDTFALSTVEVEDVCKMLREVNRSKATGLDNLPARFVSDAAEQIAPSISHIINISILQGKVPNELKLAKVTPLYKKGSKTETGNYRPVSVLSIISKVLERVVYNQIYEYIQINDLFYDLQSGFRKSYSTDTCLLNLTDHIKDEIDKGNLCGMVMLDLQKAFDTVNHDILLIKLKALGFRNDVVQWMNSYLTGREQMVIVSGTKSDTAKITCGVPQGSILGPLLFLLYVNDMNAAVDCRLLLYADDSALLISGKDVANIESKLSEELRNVSNWLVDNKLSLHLGKTESILFGSKVKLSKSPKLHVQCNGTNIESKSVVKYLGAEIDQFVSGENMAIKVIKKISSRTKFMARKGKYLDGETMKLLATALVQCHFDYACSSWYSGLSKKSKSKLQVCQNKLIRTILKLPPRTHIDHSHFKLLNWLPVEKRVTQLKLSHVHRIVSGTAPKYLSNYFIPVNNTHNIGTRSSQTSLVVPRYRSLLGKGTFKYTGAMEWNCLPLGARTIVQKENFKKFVKSYLLERVLEEETSLYV